MQAGRTGAWRMTPHDQIEAQRRSRGLYANAGPMLDPYCQLQNSNAEITKLAAALRNAALRDAYHAGGYVLKGEQPSGERTQEQIIADCEAAYAELLADIDRKRAAEEAVRIEAAKPKCAGCRWHKPAYLKGYCHQPLVKGVGAAPEAYDDYWGRQGKAKLCGPEKALWEPKLRWWEKIFDWVEEKCNYVLAYLRAMG